MADLKDHIKNRHTNFETPALTPEEEKRLQFEGMEEVVYRRMTSTKFRKKTVGEHEEAIRKAIHASVSEDKPIKITHSFGAYKIWRVPSFPYPDWAEFMSLAWFFKYGSFICGAYPPGVKYQFLSQAACISRIDNYPQEDLDAYEEKFLEVFESFKEYLPKNLKISFTRLVPDLYTRDEFEADWEKTNDELKKEPYSKEKMEDSIKLLEFNTNPKGVEDLTKLSDEELRKRYEELAYYSESILLTPKNEQFEIAEDKILVFEIPLDEVPNSIAIGSTAVSRTLHWAGCGVFEHDGERYHDRVVSPTQYDKVKGDLREVEVDGLVPGMPNRANVYEGRLSFR